MKFGKGGGPGKGAKPQTERQTERRRRKRRRGLEASPENFKKLDAISCNLAYIFGIRISFKIGPLQNKNSSGHDF